MDAPATLRTATQYACARLLADAATLEDAAVLVLRAVGEALGWDVGALWLGDPGADRIHCASVWHHPSLDAGDFARVSRETAFASGIGLPGRVWASGAAAWIPDVTVDANFPRAPAAARAGLHGALGVPILVHGRCVGVLELFTRAPQTPDAELEQFIGGIGHQLGVFIERQRIEASGAAIVAAALDCIVTIDRAGAIVEFNPAAEQTFGYRRDAVVGRPMVDVIVPPDLRERHRAGFARLLATGQGTLLGRRIEITALHASGREFPVELTITRLPAGGPALFAGFIRDITARHEADAERSAAGQRASFLAEAAAILASSLDYETTLANIARLAVPALADWCAVLIAQDDGHIRCVALVHRDPALTAAVWPYVRDYLFDPDANDGGPRVIRTGQPVLLLNEGQVNPAQQAHALRVIERNARSQRAIIDDLLDMSRIVTGRISLTRQPVSVAKTVEAALDTVRPAADAKGVVIESSLGASASTTVAGDPERLQQILWNLLSNAVKFTPRDGRVTVTGAVDAREVVLDVADTGEGIDPAVLPFVFDRFRQADSSARRRHGGLGLGLAIVRQLTELHGGTIAARSEGLGRGATFSLRLPLAR